MEKTKLVILTDECEQMQRTKEYKKLERDIIEISQMFKDLNELIYGQQDTLDLIECNISTTKEKAEKAEKELIKAEKYQKKSRWLKVGTVGILATGLGMPLGILFGAKVAVGVVSGTTLTYIVTR